jgi:hypothetical protein
MSAAEPQADEFPQTVFIKGLPEDYSMANLAVFLEKYGNLLEMQEMEDGHLLVRFQDGKSARRLVFRASGKKRQKLKLQGKRLYVIPKRNRQHSEE